VKPGWLRRFANGLVGLSAFDALFSLLEEGVRAATGTLWLAMPRSVIAELVLAGVVASLPLMLLSPRLPVAVFVPLAVATLWLTSGAAPLPLWIASPTLLGVAGCAIQLAAVGLAFALIRRHNGGRRWWFDAASPGAPAFAWRHSLGLGAAFAAVGLPAALLYLGVALATWLQIVTKGFVAFDLDGVSLADRHYQRDGREIRLVGMMHIGEPDAYRALTRTFARESTVVLAEGVSDRHARLADTLEYGRAAQALGLAPQQDLRAYLVDDDDPDALPPRWPVVRHADVDASVFSPATIACIRWAGGIWDAEDLTSAALALVEGIRTQDPQQLAAFQAEILDLRNAHLTEQIRAALGEFEHVIVPWGALHLPAIEAAVLSWGFEETSREVHPLIEWRTVAAALL